MFIIVKPQNLVPVKLNDFTVQQNNLLHYYSFNILVCLRYNSNWRQSSEVKPNIGYNLVPVDSISLLLHGPELWSLLFEGGKTGLADVRRDLFILQLI